MSFNTADTLGSSFSNFKIFLNFSEYLTVSLILHSHSNDCKLYNGLFCLGFLDGGGGGGGGGGSEAFGVDGVELEGDGSLLAHWVCLLSIVIIAKSF